MATRTDGRPCENGSYCRHCTVGLLVGMSIKSLLQLTLFIRCSFVLTGRQPGASGGGSVFGGLVRVFVIAIVIIGLL